MELNFTEAEQVFRREVQAFLAERLPAALSDKVRRGQTLGKADIEAWHAILNEQGWLANHWPVEYGGTGWGPVFRYIFEHECALADSPPIVPFGVGMLGPVLIKYGSEAQKRHWLPRILNGADWWCQGYSEPGAGSDLASLKTTAVRDGDHYVVNGQKTWTTLGQHANMMFCLVRTETDARKQEGISFLLIDMTTPGIEVRPIITLDGDHEVNEVFFTDVRVPVENLVGEENRGWTYAKYLLTYERTNIAGVGGSIAALDEVKRTAAGRRRNGRSLLDDPAFAARVARVEIELENMKTTNLRVIAAVAGGGAPGAESSMLKIRGTEIRQEITALQRRVLGIDALAQFDHTESLEAPVDGARGPAAHYFNFRKLSIFGGSNEIQRNIISKMILGL
ncbi:Pimeloyl-CoA dehydrogenase large subunit [Pararobbsia alpina]|uniref:acyl-CoA dehydrogenase family protein n=1 Tax=Pararobbsia alpina TaxID=621374 RepID=UPI0039A541A2